ncbi:MAG TPA: oligosaccharide flippase family protein [Panacibacter sp.]|nr:oligosaccharide flippase family protein [Panacibacter sp.]
MEFSKYLKAKYIFTFSSLNYLQAGISLGVSVLLARHVSREDFGYFSYGMVFANTLNVLMQFGTDRTLIRDLVQLRKPDLVISSAAWLWIAAGAICEMGILVWLIFFSGAPDKSIELVLFCSLLGFVRGMTPSAWFDFKGKMNYQTAIMLLDRLLFLACMVIIIFFSEDKQAIFHAAIAQLICRMITLAMEWKFVFRTAQIALKPAGDFILLLVKENVWVWLAAIGNLLMTQANQFILNHKTGPKELALYGLAFQIITAIRLLQSQLLRLSSPSIAKFTENANGNGAETIKKLYSFCGLTLVLSLGVVVPTYFVTPYIIKTFIGGQYLSSLPVLNVLYVWSLLFGVAIIINQFLIGLRLQRFFFISTAVFGLLSLLLANIFTEKYGAIGAALSLLLSHFCSVIFQFVIVLRTLKKMQHG